MRLIDADELLKHKTDHEYISTHLIYNAPTVDAIPTQAVRDAIVEIQNMSSDFDLNQVDEWNSKSLACIIGRCSNWAVEIISRHTGVKE